MKMFRLLLADGRDVSLSVPHGCKLEDAAAEHGIWPPEIENVIHGESID